MALQFALTYTKTPDGEVKTEHAKTGAQLRDHIKLCAGEGYNIHSITHNGERIEDEEVLAGMIEDCCDVYCDVCGLHYHMDEPCKLH